MTCENQSCDSYYIATIVMEKSNVMRILSCICMNQSCDSHMINLAGHLVLKCGCWRSRRYGGRPWHDGDTRNPSMPPAERSIGQRSKVEHREISGASREWLLTDLPWIKRGERREGYSGASL